MESIQFGDVKPLNDKLVSSSINKYGYVNTAKRILLRYLPVIIVALIFQLPYILYNEKRINDLNININPNNQNVVNIGDSPTAQKSAAPIVTESNVLGTKNTFNPDDWIIENFDKDKESYYCPTTKSFEFWNMWYREPVSPITSIKIRFKVKNKVASKLPPSFMVSIGGYVKSFSPTIDYRISIFDNDTKSVRLYNEKNKSKEQGWLENQPNLESEMIFSVSPRSINPEGRTINLNPVLTYNSFDSEVPLEFKPLDFVAILPTVQIEDKDLKRQLGIGARFGDCFKVNSVEFN